MAEVTKVSWAGQEEVAELSLAWVRQRVGLMLAIVTLLTVSLSTREAVACIPHRL